MRLFVAFDLPEEAKGRLAGLSSLLREALPRARWVASSSYHLTLAFLGEVAGEAIAPLSGALRERLEQEGGFQVHLGAVGTFPPSGPVRVAWLSLEPGVRLARLAELSRDAVRDAGLPFDGKLFRPHVTLARCDPPWPARSRDELSTLTASAVRGESATSFPCDRITLFSSELRQEGPIYRSEAEFSLRT